MSPKLKTKPFLYKSIFKFYYWSLSMQIALVSYVQVLKGLSVRSMPSPVMCCQDKKCAGMLKSKNRHQPKEDRSTDFPPFSWPQNSVLHHTGTGVACLDPFWNLLPSCGCSRLVSLEASSTFSRYSLFLSLLWWSSASITPPAREGAQVVIKERLWGVQSVSPQGSVNKYNTAFFCPMWFRNKMISV